MVKRSFPKSNQVVFVPTPNQPEFFCCFFPPTVICDTIGRHREINLFCQKWRQIRKWTRDIFCCMIVCICSLAYGQSIRTWLDADGQGAGQTVILPARRERFQGTELWHNTIHVDLYESQQVCQEYDTTDWLTKSPGCPCLNFLCNFFILIFLKGLWGETTSNHFKTVSWDFRFRVEQQQTVTFPRGNVPHDTNYFHFIHIMDVTL